MCRICRTQQVLPCSCQFCETGNWSPSMGRPWLKASCEPSCQTAGCYPAAFFTSLDQRWCGCLFYNFWRQKMPMLCTKWHLEASFKVLPSVLLAWERQINDRHYKFLISNTSVNTLLYKLAECPPFGWVSSLQLIIWASNQSKLFIWLGAFRRHAL